MFARLTNGCIVWLFFAGVNGVVCVHDEGRAVLSEH